MYYKKAIWELLENHATAMADYNLKAEFSRDQKRFDRYSTTLDGLLFDYSKQRINNETLHLLIKLAEECKLDMWRDYLFSGAHINYTENRAVLHTALRDMSSKPIVVDNINIKTQIDDSLKKMSRFVDAIHSEEWTGYTGKPIDTVINIGIGGSDLGPKMLYHALQPYHTPGITVKFVSSLDGSDLASHLGNINPETTLFTIASKTFKTQETMQNAHTAREWFLRNAQKKKHIEKHFIAISANKEEVIKFGISQDNIFEFWDWVGGRYSLWSSVGLPLALGIGMTHFNAIREGGYNADQHFLNTPYEKNIPILMALIGIWNRNFLKANSLAILPYDHLLEQFPSFLQQLDMESNGKSVEWNGASTDYETGPIIWGSSGINGQHAFFQLLHQGSNLVPIDFIGAVNSSYSLPGHQLRLVSNMIAQSEAFMLGKTLEQVQSETGEQEKSTIPYRTFEGNVPSNMFLFDHITPYSMGMLVALYEHKVFVQGVIWNINSFDQWGVELGKKLAENILEEIPESDPMMVQKAHDSSTAGLISYFRTHFMDEL